MIGARPIRNFTLMAVALIAATVLTAAVGLAQSKGDSLQPGASRQAADGVQLSSQVLLRLKAKRLLRIPQTPIEPPDVPVPITPDPTGGGNNPLKIKFLPRRVSR